MVIVLLSSVNAVQDDIHLCRSHVYEPTVMSQSTKLTYPCQVTCLPSALGLLGTFIPPAWAEFWSLNQAPTEDAHPPQVSCYLDQDAIQMLAKAQDSVAATHFTTCSAPLSIKPVAVQNHSPCIQHIEYISIFDKVNMIKNCIKGLI